MLRGQSIIRNGKKEMDKIVSVQVNGKVRTKLTVAPGEGERVVVRTTMKQATVKQCMEGPSIRDHFCAGRSEVIQGIKEVN